MRLAGEGRVHPVEVDVMIGGALKNHTRVEDPWTIVEVTLPDGVPTARVKRIDLRANRTWQPALYIPGNSDLRSVGVQVGVCRVFKDH
jgi:hypothetical protein